MPNKVMITESTLEYLDTAINKMSYLHVFCVNIMLNLRIHNLQQHGIELGVAE